MHDFSYSIPQNVMFGAGKLRSLPDLLGKLGMKKVFLVSDRGLEKLGVVGRVESIITEGGYEVESFLDVEPNPSAETVEAAAEACRASGAEGIVALGGGSSMDVAKTAGVLVAHGGSIRDYEGPLRVPGPITPVIAVPTTAGTGSEATIAAVISDNVRNYKFSVLSPEIRPHHVILDPELIYSLPAGVAASTGIDAFIHALEAYLSRDATPFSDAMGEQAMQLIADNIRAFVADRSNKEAADAMMIGSNFAGVAFSAARTGNVHALSHPVSAYFHVAHGVANAILLPPVLRFNATVDNGRYEKVYRFLTGKTVEDFKPEMLVEEVEKLLEELNMPKTLSEVGVTEDKIDQMSDDAMASGTTTANPRDTSIEDVVALYHAAM